MSEIPEGMIPAKDFATRIGADIGSVIRGIKDAVYHGKLIGDEWYVMTSSQETPSSNQDLAESGVTIIDIKMPFFSMVLFMVKWALASIPAFFILALIFAVIAEGLGIDITHFASSNF